MLLLYFRLSGWKIGLIVGGAVVVFCLIALYLYCKFKREEESRDTDTGVAPVEPDIYHTPQAGFTTSNPATTNNCPPQPHPVNNGIAPYTTDGTNPATMGIAQPPPYSSTTAYDNHGLVK